MMRNKLDLSVFEKFNFEYSPVGVKFSLAKPEGIEPLQKKMAFCEMLKEAQRSGPFFATVENHECMAGPLSMGMIDPDPVSESGYAGPKLGIYEDSRANRRVYTQLPKLGKYTVNYTVFSSLRDLSFDPDVFIITAKPSQAEIILRANGYKTGAAWNAKGTTISGCAWLYIHPFISGELNMLITGLHHGMKTRNLFPEGLIFLSIPFDRLPDIVDSLQCMEWDLPQYSWGKEAHVKRMKQIAEEIKQELQR